MVEATFLVIIEVIGTVAFAISGIRLAASKHFDWFGAYTVGLVTAIGGGTVRDVLLDIPVFWMQSWWYLAVTGLALALVILFRSSLVRRANTLFIFDAIGLALFVMIGIDKTLTSGYPMWVAIIMGMITGAFGGVVRDILINEEPLFFRKDIYATACIAGGVVYWVTSVCGANPYIVKISGAITVIALRVLAVKFSWQLPTMRDDNQYAGNERRRDEIHKKNTWRPW